MDLLPKVKGFIRKKELLRPKDKILLAVSGGPDSVALLDLLCRLKEPWGLKLAVAYFHHGLRPEARQEALFVKNLAVQRRLPFILGAAATRTFCHQRGLSLEEGARELRYRFLQSAAQKGGYDLICLGHTYDDQAEEILIRLIRGAGRGGLAGIPARRHPFVRPLLGVTKAEILEYLKARGLSFCEDPSNRDRRFLRNRIRFDLIPYLEKRFNPRIKETLWQTAEILSEEEQFLREETRKRLKKYLRESHQGLLLKREALHEPLTVRRRFYLALIRELAPQIKAGFRHLEMIEDIFASSSPGPGLHLGRLRIRKTKEGLLFSPPRPIPQPFELLVPGPGHYLLKEGLALQVERQKDGLYHPQETEVILDAQQVVFPITVRSPRPGDRFHPLGGPGEKKVFRFLADCGVDRERRNLYPVVVSRGQILAVLPLRPAERARVKTETQEIIKFRLLPKDNNTY